MAAGRARAERRIAPIRTIDTPHGPARAEVQRADAASGAVVLGHGAGGGVHTVDLDAAAQAALTHGLSVALVEQPYRVAGRRSPAPATQLDASWQAVVVDLAQHELRDLPLLVGGRSAGARVACRTAAATAARGVICLAFPLHPPGKADDLSKSRLPELEAVALPVLVVQGERDPFGIPPAGPRRTVTRITGDHSLRDPTGVRDAVGTWLASLNLSGAPG